MAEDRTHTPKRITARSWDKSPTNHEHRDYSLVRERACPGVREVRLEPGQRAPFDSHSQTSSWTCIRSWPWAFSGSPMAPPRLSTSSLAKPCSAESPLTTQ